MRTPHKAQNIFVYVDLAVVTVVVAGTRWLLHHSFLHQKKNIEGVWYRLKEK